MSDVEDIAMFYWILYLNAIAVIIIQYLAYIAHKFINESEVYRYDVEFEFPSREFGNDCEVFC